MPAAPTRPHVAALTAALTGAGLTVLPGGQGTPVPPCVVLWPTPGEPGSSSLADIDDLLLVEVTLAACGTTSDQAMWVSDQLTNLLNKKVLTVPGRTLDPLRLVEKPGAAQRDDVLATSSFSAATRWRITSRPAP